VSKELILPMNAMRDRAVVDDRANNPLLKKINYELQQMDPYLECVWVSDRFPTQLIPGMVPGRWHVRRSQPGVVDSYFPIVGPDNEYRDLGMDLIENMKAADLWKPGAIEELASRRQRRQKRIARERALDREQTYDHLKEDMRAVGRLRGDGGMKKRRQVG
jgi:hypothetical protein